MSPASRRRTKIVATLGPAAEPHLPSLVRAGLDVARLNFSHDTHDVHERRLHAVRAAAEDEGRRVAVLVDLQGPKVRTGPFAGGSLDLREGEEALVKPGRETGGVLDGRKTIFIDYPKILEALRDHRRLYLADGLLELEAERVFPDRAVARVLAGGTLGDHKGVNVPHASWDLPALRPKDEADARWAVENDADFVAQSFVRNAEDVRRLRALLDRLGGQETRIIAKIEEYDAVKNLDGILEAADGLMVARGDLGMQLPYEQVPGVQKDIIRKCNAASKPVITATQMLDSMTANPLPTRAEVTDIANAVLDGSDALMLSNETTVGKHPVRAVQSMARVIEETEARGFDFDRFPPVRPKGERALPREPHEPLGEAVCRLASELHAGAIVAYTTTGATPRYIARFRPRAPVIAITPDERVARRLCLVWGTTSLVLAEHDELEDALTRAGEAARASGLVKAGELVVVSAGTPFGTRGTTNLLNVQRA
jgi:pyruvate kinase